MNDDADEIPDWYFGWAAYHAAAFSLTEKCQAVLLAWGPVWSRLHAEADLRGATRRMVAGAQAVPRFVSDQRDRIVAESRLARGVRLDALARAGGPPGASAPPCDLCGGTGCVVVPHPGTGRDGRWLGYLTVPNAEPGSSTDERLLCLTAAVDCYCDTGLRSRDWHAQIGKPSLSVGRYDALYPNWRAVAAARAALAAAPERPASPADVRRLVTALAAGAA